MTSAIQAKLQHLYQHPDLSMSIEERVRTLEALITDDPNHQGPDAVACKGVRLTKVEPGRTEWELDIKAHHVNFGQNLHGGAACTILDNLTSTALLTIAKPGFLDSGHVSRTITMTYLRPVPIGSTVQIECSVVAAGRNTANLQGTIRLNGKTCVTCIHDKAVFSTKSEKL